MAFKFAPCPLGEGWDCLQCAMNVSRETEAVVLLIEGEKGVRGVNKTGMCGNHAEVMSIADLRVAQQKFREACDEEVPECSK